MSKIILLLFSLFLLNACNTISGIGRDIGAAGDGLQRSADKHRGY